MPITPQAGRGPALPSTDVSCQLLNSILSCTHTSLLGLLVATLAEVVSTAVGDNSTLG